MFFTCQRTLPPPLPSRPRLINSRDLLLEFTAGILICMNVPALAAAAEVRSGGGERERRRRLSVLQRHRRHRLHGDMGEEAITPLQDPHAVAQRAHGEVILQLLVTQHSQRLGIHAVVLEICRIDSEFQRPQPLHHLRDRLGRSGHSAAR